MRVIFELIRNSGTDCYFFWLVMVLNMLMVVKVVVLISLISLLSNIFSIAKRVVSVFHFLTFVCSFLFMRMS